MNTNILTIDGVSGVGKGATSKLIATALNWNLLDSGAIYRSVAYYLHTHQLMDSITNEMLMSNTIRELDIVFDNERVIMNDRDITVFIRNEEIATITSAIASIPYIRLALKLKQRCFISSTKGLVADGRDMGTRIFPEAKYKIFLIADIKVRAKRRLKQLHPDSNHDKIPDIYSSVFTSTLQSMQNRDQRDKKNTYPASDALVIDNTTMALEEVVNKILGYMQVRR